MATKLQFNRKPKIEIDGAPVEDGVVWFSTDTQEIFMDNGDVRDVYNGQDVDVSETEPTNDSTKMWINPSFDETFQVPEINDDEVSDVDTWSSNKIDKKLKESFVTPEMFGAKGDGVTDDTDAIQKCFNSEIKIKLLQKNYLVVATGNEIDVLTVKKNSVVIINGIITLQANDFDTSRILNINDCENVLIYGSGSIIGDLETHTGETGEYGHCIRIWNSKNIVIDGITLKNAWGDGLYIGGQSPTKISEDVIIRNCNITDNGRNSVSACDCENTIIENCIIGKAIRTAPKSNLDIEPNWYSIKNIIIRNNLFTESETRSIITSLQNSTDNHILIENNKLIEVKANGIYVSGNENNYVISKNNYIEIKSDSNFSTFINSAVNDVLCSYYDIFAYDINGSLNLTKNFKLVSPTFTRISKSTTNTIKIYGGSRTTLLNIDKITFDNSESAVINATSNQLVVKNLNTNTSVKNVIDRYCEYNYDCDYFVGSGRILIKSWNGGVHRFYVKSNDSITLNKSDCTYYGDITGNTNIELTTGLYCVELNNYLNVANIVKLV